MTYENITLRKQNMTMVDGYFYMFDEAQDSMIVKTDDGTQAYSYPLDTAVDNEIISMEHDGRNFWTLENPGSDTVLIKRWNIENYVLKEQDSFTMSPDASHKYDSQAMTVEHYHLRFHSTTSPSVHPNQAYVYIPKTKIADVDLTAKLTSGMTITVGPNSSGQLEDIQVTNCVVDTLGATETIYRVDLNSSVTYTYSGPTVSGSDDYRERYGDEASFYNKIWLFNDYDGLTADAGALYYINAYTGSYQAKYPGGEYAAVNSCTFFDVPNYVLTAGSSNWPKYNSIAYVRTTNLIFLNVGVGASPDFDNSYGSLTMDNINANQIDIFTIYDLSMEGVNVYRLQSSATYYGATYPWSSYNYQLSTLEPFITSISLRADPAILPANGTSTSVLTAIVKDQWNQAIPSKNVYFTEDDPDGSIGTPNPATTDSDGVAITTYTAGNSAREVKITATAEQGGITRPTD